MGELINSTSFWLIPALYGVCFGGLGYSLLRALRESSENYAREYTVDTARQLEDLFLFIPARRLLEMARIAALSVFLVIFFTVAELKSASGVIIGLASGGAAGTITLFTPRLILKVLRNRRRDRFEEQLVDALITMSNALRAGYSIIQSFESVVEERRNPIAQEFGMFLQQLRVGVKFEDALDEMVARVESEDLSLMALSIETARQTGGNLTEVFDKIALTLRERMQIQGKVRSLTAQGRMQGIVVGLMPVLLFFVLAMIDPDLMMDFYASLPGAVVLATVLVLEILGLFFIHRIVKIDI